MATCTNCNTALSLDYSPSVLNMKGLMQGYSYSDFIDFFDESGTAEDITGDTFEMVIEGSDGSTVASLTTVGGITVGGLEIEGQNRLKFLISDPVTDLADTYTYTLILVNATTGDNYPVVVGKIVVV